MTRPTNPPRLANILLRILLPHRTQDTVLADLEEEYHTDIVATCSARNARLWYWREAASLIRWYLVARFRKRPQHNLQKQPPISRRKQATALSRVLCIFESVLQDVRYGARSLHRRPDYAIVAIVTLGLGIGATTTMFSVIEGVLLRQLPFDEPGRIVNAWITNDEWRDHPFFNDYWDKGPLAWSDYERWRDATTQFQSVAVHSEFTMTLTGLGDPVQVSVGLASAGLFHTLGVDHQIGRGFLPGEDGSTAARLVVLSHSVWRGRFAADPAVLGKTLTLDGNSYSVVGVLPAGFRLRTLVLGNPGSDGDRAVWIPLGQPEILGGLEGQRMEGLGRLAAGVSIEQASAETTSLFAEEEGPSPLGARLVPRKSEELGNYRAPLLLLFGAAGVLLLAACSNVAMLAIGEATGRKQEITTRAALGASAPRLIRQTITESALLGLLGSVLGIFVAYAATAVLVSLGPPIPRIDGVHVSLRILFFACSVGIATGILFGIAPSALFSGNARELGVDRSGSRTTTAGRNLQNSVITLEIALTAVLLVAGGLLTRSLTKLYAVDPGFHATNLATFHVPLPESKYPSGTETSDFFHSVQRQIEAIPSVLSASGTAALPFGQSFAVETPVLWFQIVGRETVEGEPAPQGWRGTALPRFHETLGVPILAGRGFTEADNGRATKVALVNEAMARRYWIDESPVGATIELGEEERTIVGIVGNVRHGGLDVDVEPMIHLPQSQHPTHGLSFVARTNGDPRDAIPQLRDAVWSIDPDVPVTRVGTMESLIARSGSDERYRTLLMMVFAITAVVVATGGVFSVTAQGVVRQTRELGIRVALGAKEHSLLGMVLRKSLITAAVGTLTGLLIALWATRILSQFLFVVEKSDPVTYFLVGVLLMVVCLSASLLPALRVSRVDPVEVLKAE